MSTTLKKSLLIGLGIFILIIVTIGVVYLVRKPATVVSLPSPTPRATPVESPTETAVPAPIFAIENAVCKKSFVVACVSPSPSSSVSPSVSPSPSSSVSPSVSPSPSSSVSPSPSTVASAALDCVSKKMYFDDSRNRSGFYYLESEITDTTTLSNGDTVVYNVIAKNTGGNSAPDTTITDTLSANLTYVDGDSGCIYDSTTRVVTCTIGALSPNSEAQRSFRAKVTDVSGTTAVANTAEVTSTNGQRDSCSVQINAAGQVVTTSSASSPQPTSLPVAGVFEVTAGTLGIGLLLLILGGLGLLLI